MRLCLVLFSVTFAGCASVGPDKLVSTHIAYNEAVQLSITREVLINIVRGRYSDPMSFLHVQSINAQFSLNVQSDAGVGGSGKDGTVGEVGGSMGYSDAPTITFVPQSDGAFYKSMHSPLDMEDVFGLMHWGRLLRGDEGSEERILRFLFASINGVSEISMGKPNLPYETRIKALATLFRSGAYLQQMAEWSVRGPKLDRNQLSGEEQVSAYDRGLYFIDEDLAGEDGDKVMMALSRPVVALVIPDQSNSMTQEALRDLGVDPGRKHYIFRPIYHLSPGQHEPHSIWITPRSFADVLSISGQFVQIPDAHLSITQPVNHTMNASIQIRFSETEPPYPYRVKHRGYWFYVDDSDINSKVFLRHLVGLYKSRIGTKQAQDKAPQLVLPIGW